MVRLAVVGIGGYGWSLVKLIQDLADDVGCRLIAVAEGRLDALPERARELEAAGVTLFDDAFRMFEELRGRCDGVYIATGIGSHAVLAIRALEAGFHVHLEKPPAATVQEMDAMIAAAESAGKGCLVGFQALHSRDIRFLKDRVVLGRFGRVRSLTCSAGWPRRRSYYERNEWAGRLRSGGNWVLDGPAMNALAHQVTNMLFLASQEAGKLAEPAAVRGEMYATGDVDAHDTAAIEIATAEGPTLRFLASHRTGGQFGPVIEIEAEKATVEWEMWKGARITYVDGTEETCDAAPDSGRDRMVANFVQAAREGDPSILGCPLVEARKFVLALDGAYESSGRTHRIPDGEARVDASDDGDERVIVAGMDDALKQAGARRRLISDLDDAPDWAVATEPFDLRGYQQFPQRFQAD